MESVAFRGATGLSMLALLCFPRDRGIVTEMLLEEREALDKGKSGRLCVSSASEYPTVHCDNENVKGSQYGFFTYNLMIIIAYSDVSFFLGAMIVVSRQAIMVHFLYSCVFFSCFLRLSALCAMRAYKITSHLTTSHGKQRAVNVRRVCTHFSTAVYGSRMDGVLYFFSVFLANKSKNQRKYKKILNTIDG